jgi:formate dehydrogenase maturation protein FdhE
MRRTFNICQKNGSGRIGWVGINRYCSKTTKPVDRPPVDRPPVDRPPVGSSVKRLINITDNVEKKMIAERKIRLNEHYKNVNEKLDILESKFMNNDFESNMKRNALYGNRKVYFNFKANEFSHFHNFVGERICPSIAVQMMIQRWILKNPNWKGLEYYTQTFVVGSDEVTGFFYY